jgi:hypothetical protein
VEPISTLFVAVGSALLAVAPVRWAYNALGIGQRPPRGSAQDVMFWREFAGRFHLVYEHDAERRPGVHGAIEGIAFTVRPSGPPRGDSTPMAMTAVSHAPLSAVPLLQHLPDRVRTGDEGFDALCRAAGDPATVVATLDAHARTQVAALLTGGGRIERGQASLVLPSKLDEEAARAGANLVFHAAYAIDHAPADRLARLLRIADEDPVPAVRARALWVAASLAPSDPGVTERLTRASRSPTDRHQDFVGRVTRADRTGCAELLAEAEDPSLVLLAGLTLPPPQLGPALQAVLATTKPDLQLALAEVALHADDATRLELLAALAQAAGLASDEGAAALRDLVVRCEDLRGDAFDRTLATLATHPGDAVADAALAALRKHGTVRAVSTLRAAEAQVPRARADRIRSTIAAIQASVGPVDAGRLTVADEDGRGRVSVAPQTGSDAADTDDEAP